MKKIGITLGDPAGIGPEISIKAFAKKDLYERCQPLLVGDACVVEKYLQAHPELNLKLNVIDEPDQGKYVYGMIDLIDLKAVDINQLAIGEVSAMAGNAAFQYVKKSD